MKIKEDSVKIIPYTEAYKDDLIRLTLEWINKDFVLEPEDHAFINNPKEYVIDKGGYIFLAKYENEIIGTVSLYRTSNAAYELAKLAVTESYKGQHIGKKLMQKAIDLCREVGAKRIFLYTNSKLIPANKLYTKMGFVNRDVDPKYIQADVSMELDLTT